MTAKNKTKKLISSLLIILILLPAVLLSFPKKGYAIWGIGDAPVDATSNIAGATSNGTTAGATTNIAATQNASLSLQLKDVAIAVGKEVLKAVAKRLLAEMTKATVNWINSGFHGEPLFLKNPQSFFSDIAKSELQTIVDTFGYNELLYPFGRQFALNAITSYKNQLNYNAQYSLSTVMNSAQIRLMQNFSYGGWNGFLINTQYPQNNYLGFNMIATEALARNIQGSSLSSVKTVQTALQQGMGFLSPQMCPASINPSYNNGTNPFVKPSFDEAAYNKSHPAPDAYGIESDAAQNEYDRAVLQWRSDHDYAKTEWAKTNTCVDKNGKSGLVNTTPGSVASAQIANALNVPNLTTALDGAVGNSLSAIFDALLNHFLDKGLTALATTINPPPVTDNWSYNGQTLGSASSTGTDINSDWSAGPDQPIVLNDFKQTVNDSIDSVSTELALLYNNDTNNPGLYQMYGKIWRKAQELDACIPGPDVVGLQGRIDAEVEKTNTNLQDKAAGGILGGSKTETANSIETELASAMKLFKDWIDNKMMPELPSSLIYMDSVKSITTLSQEMSALTDNRIAKNRALVRLEAIKTNLDTITTEPDPGSAKDQILVSIWKQYQAGSVDFSNTNTIEDTRNKLSEAKDIYNNLVDSMDPSNPTSCPAERTAKGWSNPGGPDSTFISSGKTERALFCDLPISGGYSHKEFVNTTEVTYPDIPLVNAREVMTYKTITLQSFLASLAPGFTWGGGLSVPVLPFVDVPVNIEISCDNIFNASLIDYKGNLPGVVSDTPLHADSADTLGNCKYNNGVTETNLTKAQCTANTGTWGPLAALGTCTMPIPNVTPASTMPIPNTTKADCTAAKGTWIAN